MKEEARVLKDMSVRIRTPKDAKALVISAILLLIASPGTLALTVLLAPPMLAILLRETVVLGQTEEEDLRIADVSEVPAGGEFCANGSPRIIKFVSMPLLVVARPDMTAGCFICSEGANDGG